MQIKKIIIFLGVLLLAFFVMQIGFPKKKMPSSSQAPVQSLKEIVVEGIVVTNVAQTRSLTIDQHGKKIYLLLLEKATIQNSQGKTIQVSDIKKDFVIEAKSTVKGNNFFIVSSLKVLQEPVH